MELPLAYFDQGSHTVAKETLEGGECGLVDSTSDDCVLCVIVELQLECSADQAAAGQSERAKTRSRVCVSDLLQH
jgi:hypothetical protein